MLAWLPKMAFPKSLAKYVDIQLQYKKVTQKQQVALPAMVKEILNVEWCEQVKHSDWSARPLSKLQQHYAHARSYCLMDMREKLDDMASKNAGPRFDRSAKKISEGENYARTKIRNFKKKFFEIE